MAGVSQPLAPPPTMPPMDDPFLSTPSQTQPSHPLRHGAFNPDAFSLQPHGSPRQARLAVQAHLKETDKRIQEASKLGSSLVQQRKELAARLKELSEVQDTDELGPDLRKKMTDLERDYDDVGRESARVFLPRSRLASNDNTDPTLSPAVFSGVSGASPSKVAIASRKQRNQPSTRVHDIEFATEISTSLLAQVRTLQAALQEKDDALKRETSQRSHLESEHAAILSRLKHLDENQQNYKDVNWNLETQMQELSAALREATEKEQRSNQLFRSTQSDKEALMKELEDLRQAHGKLTDDHTASKRAQEADIHLLRRDLTNQERDKAQLQRRIDELTAQNGELARAVNRMNSGAGAADYAVGAGDDVLDGDRDFDELSPPPSPSKRAVGGMLETETLKSSIAHAHRMIQTLKNNIHREKTEKLELKRMLQDARDELESKRGDNRSNNLKKRTSALESTKTRKIRADQLGSNRVSREEIINDEDWEDSEGEATFGAHNKNRQGKFFMPGAFTASEESTDAFETANEKDTSTETEAFQTGNEAFDDGESSGEATETEAGTARVVLGKARPVLFSNKRASYMSTASTSADEDARHATPVNAPAKYKIKNGKARASFRESAAISSNNNSPAFTNDFNNSPAFSAGSSTRSTPVAAHNLGDELDGLSDEESITAGTPSRVLSGASVASVSSTPASAQRSAILAAPVLALQQSQPAMVDSAMMTEPWDPETMVAADNESHSKSLLAAAAGAVGGFVTGGLLGRKEDQSATAAAEDENPSLPASPEPSGRDRAHASYTLSSIISHYTAPMTPAKNAQESPSSHSFNNILVQQTEPSNAVSPEVSPVPLHGFAAIRSQQIEPVAAPIVEPAVVPVPIHAFTSIVSQHTEPRAVPASTPDVSSPQTPEDEDSHYHTMSLIKSQHYAPVAPAGGFVVFPARDSSRQADAVAIADVPKASRRPEQVEHDVENEPSLEVFQSEKIVRAPFVELSHNAAPQVANPNAPVRVLKEVVPTSDEGTQTTVSSEEIDMMLRNKDAAAAVDGAILGSAATAYAARPFANMSSPRRSSEPGTRAEGGVLYRTGSAASIRSIKSHTPPPPLPVDHNQKIAQAAAGKAGTMGPPLMPASAYRINQQSSSRGRNASGSTGQKTPSLRAAPVAGTAKADTRSPMTRTSSFSSFASEVDNRLNPAGAFAYPSDLPASTDPRMIAAITQTMIGEYLWKYTRSPLSSHAMSSNRHRRFFWVHPYTRTLYWSETDPSAAGKTQTKAKSVAIEAVRVISDDNAYPPGLHSKSLVVVTPGRELVFTAPTGQRHETWFNSLSYLLLRTTGEDDNSNAAVMGTIHGGGDGELNDEDVAEFNPSYGRSTGAAATGLGISRPNQLSAATRGSVSHASLTSHHSASTTGRGRFNYMETPTLGPGPGAQNNFSSRSPERATATGTNGATALSMTKRSPSVSGRIGSFFGRGRGSVSSRYSRDENGASAQNNGTNETASSAGQGQSADDIRRQIEEAERLDRLENVRSCCDGKHDVGDLPRQTDTFRGRHEKLASGLGSHSHRT